MALKMKLGNLSMLLKKGIWSFDKVYCGLGVFVTELKNVRDDDEITIFKSVGAAYYDIVVAKGVYQKAKQQGFGIEINI
ncbi:hypothetical protein M2M59_08260 [Rummeliibacillus sp. G93]|uniref:hypothetical protein n=1 Tax=Rummeliibacillus sp. G93 TaxID=2939494 RepID=UPI00201C7476|nr:hypothetical protein [Rummeliibacillus sp. G93]UQW96015.1 hypothetical protein M2M59_08260 [Rummeliibacillus sp. G93]